MLEISNCLSHAWVTTAAASSCVYQPCHVQDTAFQRTLLHPMALTFCSAPSSVLFPESRGWGGPGRYRCSIYGSLLTIVNFQQWWVCALTTLQYNKKRLWPRLGEAHIYDNEHKYSETVWQYDHLARQQQQVLPRTWLPWTWFWPCL